MRIAQALVHHPRHGQGAFHGFQAALLLAAVRSPDISQADRTPWLALQPHPCLGVLPLLPRLPHEGSEVLQGRVLAVEIEGNGQIRVGGMERQAYLVVDRGLAVGVVILAHLGDGPPHHNWRCRKHGWKRRGHGWKHR